MDIKEALQEQRDNWEHLGVPRPIEDFVLRWGTSRSGQLFAGEQWQIKKCYSNAMELAIRDGLNYVEGFAGRLDVPFLFSHAWCEDEDGKVIDPTWDDPEKAVYMGVSFPRAMALGVMMNTGVYGLYDLGCGTQIKFLEAETARREALIDG